MLKTLWKKIIKLFYPDRCICCDKIISEGDFCKNCEGLVEPIKVKLCFKCGLPTKLCGCDWNFYYFKGVITCFENVDDIQKSFYGFKFRGHYDRGKYYADSMLSRIKQGYTYIDFDYVCIVPTHKSSVKERGYDQTKVLAKIVARGMKVPFKNLLTQPKITKKQHETEDYKARYENVKGKYKTINAKDISGKTILLIDDIKTTGATLSECARELMLAGAKVVYAATALVTYPKKEDKKTNNFAIYEDGR